MSSSPYFNTGWNRYFYGPPEPVPPAGKGDAPPPNQPEPQGKSKSKATPAPRLRWRPIELDVLVSQVPKPYRAEALDWLRSTLDYRAKSEKPPHRPEDAPFAQVQRGRFGLRGERLEPQRPADLYQETRVELREILWTLETVPLRLVRNYYVAMHAARLGQLTEEMRRRAMNVPAVLRGILIPLWE